MRLPVSKAYRAFPELDAFTDAECERLAFRARAYTSWYPSEGGTGIFLVFSVLGVLGAFLTGWLLSLSRTRDHSQHDLIPGGVLIAFMAAGVILGLCYRDYRTRTIVAAQVRRTACPGCGNSLLGSPRSADSVRCSKCAAVHAFTSLKIIGEDLGPPMIVLDANTQCGACGYVIGGLPIHRGQVTCPECGAKTSVVQHGDPTRSDA